MNDSRRNSIALGLIILAVIVFLFENFGAIGIISDPMGSILNHFPVLALLIFFFYPSLLISLILAIIFFISNYHKYPTLRNFSYSFLFFIVLLLISAFTTTLFEAASIGIIGAADGPSTIFVGNRFRHLSFLGDSLPAFISLVASALFFIRNYHEYPWWKNWLYSLLILVVTTSILIYASTMPITFKISDRLLYNITKLIPVVIFMVIFSLSIAVLFFYNSRHLPLSRNIYYSVMIFLGLAFFTLCIVLPFIGLKFRGR